MAADPDRLILYLTFANDRASVPEDLRNLAEESRRLRRTLKAAPYAHTYAVKHEDHARLDDILDSFQQHRDRVALFHFGDHTDSYYLLTEQTGGNLTLTDRMVKMQTPSFCVTSQTDSKGRWLLPLLSAP